MSEKIIGYLLLTLGLVMILIPAVNIYQILTKKAKPVQIFSFNDLSIDLSQIIPSQPEINTEGLPQEQAQMIKNLFKNQGKSPSNPKIEVIPVNVLNETVNLFAHLFLIGFIASLGYKIAGIGVLMLRPIIVKLKEKNEQSN